MGFGEALAPIFQSGNLAHPADDFHDQPVAIAPGEEVKSHETKDNNQSQGNAHGRRQRQIAHKHKAQVEEDRSEPKPEVGEDVHHGIQNHRRGGVLLGHVAGELHDAVGLASEPSDGCGVVECVARNSQAVDAPKGRALVGVCVAVYDGLPGKSVDGIDHDPNADDGDEPVACMAEMLPKFDKADVEGEEHHHHSGQAEDEEQVVETLFGPGHKFRVRGWQPCRQSRGRNARDDRRYNW